MVPTFAAIPDQFGMTSFGTDGLGNTFEKVWNTIFYKSTLDISLFWPDVADLWDDEDTESDVFEVDLRLQLWVRNVLHKDTTRAEGSCDLMCSGLNDPEVWGEAFEEDGKLDLAHSRCDHYWINDWFKFLGTKVLKMCYQYVMATMIENFEVTTNDDALPLPSLSMMDGAPEQSSRLHSTLVRAVFYILLTQLHND